MPVFFALRLLEWLLSYDGIKFGQLKSSRQKSINSYTCIFWDIITRGVINSVCSPVVIQTLTLYRTSLFFLPSLLMKKKKNCFIIFPTLDVHIDEDRETRFSPQPLKLSTWFLHDWDKENLLHLFSLNVIFRNLFFLAEISKIWCSELFDVLQ